MRTLLKVLIIEDSEAKSEAICTFLLNKNVIEYDIDIQKAGYLSAAVALVSTSKVDLIILDLLLPYIADGQADARAGLEMVKLLRNTAGPNANTTILGLSAFPEEVQEARAFFESSGVLIVPYNESTMWRDALKQVLHDIGRRVSTRQSVDFIIFTALDEERSGYDATDLKFIKESTLSGLNICYVEFGEAASKRRGVLIKLRQMGVVASTLEASIALAIFDTRVICMSGICAGFSRNAKSGQLIIGSPVWEYQAGKWSGDGFQIAPTQIPLPAHTRVILEQITKSHDFHVAIEAGISRSVVRPSSWAEPVLAPAATGSAVIADSEKLKHVEQQHRKVAAIDMEAFGMYYAAHEFIPAIKHYFSIKCVVDFADREKADDLHVYGCAASASAIMFILKRLCLGE